MQQIERVYWVLYLAGVRMVGKKPAVHSMLRYKLSGGVLLEDSFVSFNNSEHDLAGVYHGVDQAKSLLVLAVEVHADVPDTRLQELL